MANKQLISCATKAGPPTINDDALDGYFVGDQLFDTAGLILYRCSDNTPGAAVWQVISPNAQTAGLAVTALQNNPVATTWYNFGGIFITNLEKGTHLLEAFLTWEAVINAGAADDLMAVEAALAIDATPALGVANGYATMMRDDGANPASYFASVALKAVVTVAGGEDVYIHGRVHATLGTPTSAFLQLLGDDVLVKSTFVMATKLKI